MAEKPEELARVEIDKLLAEAGWSVETVKEANIHSTRGVTLCNFVCGGAIQSDNRMKGLPAALPRGEGANG